MIVVQQRGETRHLKPYRFPTDLFQQRLADDYDQPRFL